MVNDLPTYRTWWHKYGETGREVGERLASHEDMKVKIAAFDSSVQDLRDLVNSYNFASMMEEFREYFPKKERTPFELAAHRIFAAIDALFSGEIPMTVLNTRDRVAMMINTHLLPSECPRNNP